MVRRSACSPLSKINQMAVTDPRFVDIKALAEACKLGRVDEVRELLARNPEVVNSPDYDTRFHYPESCLWSPLGIAATNGREQLVRWLLDHGADPVPFEVAGQYHSETYGDWTDHLRERGYHSIAEAIEGKIAERYGPRLDAELSQAIAEGNIERARTLLDERPERVHQVDCAGNGPLHMAVAADDEPMARLLLERGSRVDAINGGGRTPAVVALYGLHRWWRDEDKAEILELLLGNGASYTLLIAAARGDEAGVREVLREDPELANAADPCWRRPLSAASSKGHEGVVRLLLEHGADPNAKEAICQGGYSLHEAAERGYIEIVRLLLEKGAIPEHWVDSSGDAVFAAQQHPPEILHLMYSYGATMELKVYAAKHRIDVIAEVLKLAPEKADEVFPYGWEDNGSEELALNIMRLAIRYGARFENASAWNLRWTARKYRKVFRLLQAHGASAEKTLFGVAGDVQRRYGSAEEQLRLIAFLVEECGADVNFCGDEGLTVLAAAAREGHREIVEYLLSKGADPDREGPEWAKPASLAEHRGHIEMVELLRRRT